MRVFRVFIVHSVCYDIHYMPYQFGTNHNLSNDDFISMWIKPVHRPVGLAMTCEECKE